MTDWYAHDSLPGFTEPPVVEVAMSVEFAPIPGLDIFGLVQLQSLWQDKYPIAAENMGVPSTPSFADGPGIQFNFPTAIHRIWAGSADNRYLVQTQADRLVLNWRKMAPFDESEYPGYLAYFRSEMLRLWDLFMAFLDDRGLQRPAPHMTEFTYVNAVAIAEGEEVSDIVSIVKTPELPLPGQNGPVRFAITRDVPVSTSDRFAAQISVSGEPQVREDGSPALLFTVMVRTLPGSDEPFDALDAAHALASHTFARIVTQEKQHEWGRKQ